MSDRRKENVFLENDALRCCYSAASNRLFEHIFSYLSTFTSALQSREGCSRERTRMGLVPAFSLRSMRMCVMLHILLPAHERRGEIGKGVWCWKRKDGSFLHVDVRQCARRWWWFLSPPLHTLYKAPRLCWIYIFPSVKERWNIHIFRSFYFCVWVFAGGRGANHRKFDAKQSAAQAKITPVCEKRGGGGGWLAENRKWPHHPREKKMVVGKGNEYSFLNKPIISPSEACRIIPSVFNMAVFPRPQTKKSLCGRKPSGIEMIGKMINGGLLTRMLSGYFFLLAYLKTTLPILRFMPCEIELERNKWILF